MISLPNLLPIWMTSISFLLFYISQSLSRMVFRICVKLQFNVGVAVSKKRVYTTRLHFGPGSDIS